MIEELINLFYNLSREHVYINSFKYDTLSRGQGVGNEYYPQFFLEEPILINNNNFTDNVTTATVSFDILITAQTFENYETTYPTEAQLQSLAHSIGLNIIAKINEMYNEWLNDELNPYQPFKVLSYNFLTLRYFYDNNTSGVRCSLKLERKNPLNKCNIDVHFNPDKKFEIDKLLPNIPTPDPQGCILFDYKLPEIDY
jgi:hypothetical protein